MFFVTGITIEGTHTAMGPFDSYEEAQLWADTHDFYRYTVNEEWDEPLEDDDDDWYFLDDDDLLFGGESLVA